MHNNSAINYYIDAKNEWDTVTVPNQNLNKFYNLFINDFSKYKYITVGTSEDYSKNNTLRINTVGTGLGGQGIFGGCGGFGICIGRGCGGRGHD